MTNWAGKVVVVTGASEGLGFRIAESFHHRGAKVVLAARRQELLVSAKSRLDAQTDRGSVVACPADVTDGEDVARLVSATVDTFGGIDVWVNNAGRSDRGRAMDCPLARYRELLELNFLAAVRCTGEAMPYLLRSRGSLVNIGSLSAKTASPFLGGYAPSKFALAAYTQQLRLEMHSQGLHVLFVCPGPIAREGSHVRTQSRDPTLPDAAYAPGGGVQLKLLRPERIARDIVRACERRTLELVYPARARFLFALQQWCPRLGDWIVRRKTLATWPRIRGSD